MFSGFNSQVNKATNEIQIITQETNISINDLKDCVIESFADVSWEDPIEGIKLITSSEWLNGTLKEN
ncbi:MAG: hypothetical protein ACI4PF_02440, partial [Christensenellales bacterium]